MGAGVDCMAVGARTRLCGVCAPATRSSQQREFDPYRIRRGTGLADRAPVPRRHSWRHGGAYPFGRMAFPSTDRNGRRAPTGPGWRRAVDTFLADLQRNQIPCSTMHSHFSAMTIGQPGRPIRRETLRWLSTGAQRRGGGSAARTCRYHGPMPVEEPDAQVASDATSPQPSPTPQPGWVAPAALALAVIAVAVAIGGALWASTRTPDAPAVTAQQPDGTAQQPDGTALQPDAAKARACAAFDMVRKAVSVQTNINLGPDAVAKVAVAANARLATLGGSQYLLSRLDPATPADLADAARSFANNLQDVAMLQLVGTPNTDAEVAALMSEAQTASQNIATICK